MIEMLALAAVITLTAEPTPTPINQREWVKPSDYPVEAARARTQGTVGFRLDVDKQGRPTACSITLSSTSAVLDSAACRLMITRARFEPAKTKNGTPIASRYNSRIRWAAPAVPSAPPPPGLLVVTMELSPEGKVTTCSAEASGGVPASQKEVACKVADGSPRAQFLTAHGAAYKTIRTAMAISTEAQKYPIDGANWGTLLMRRASDVHIRKDGQAVRCTVTASVGGNIDADMCDQMRNAGVLVGDSGDESAQVMHFENALFGIRR